MAKILKRSSITVNGLPDTCTQKAHLLSLVADPNQASVNVVLALDGGQYIGYIGYPSSSDLREELKNSRDALYHCNRIRTHDQVARLGDRVNDVTRDILFPTRS